MRCRVLQPVTGWRLWGTLRFQSWGRRRWPWGKLDDMFNVIFRTSLGWTSDSNLKVTQTGPQNWDVVFGNLLQAGGGGEHFKDPQSTPVKDQPSTSCIPLVLTSPQPRPRQSSKSPTKSLSDVYLAFPVIRERRSLSVSLYIVCLTCADTMFIITVILRIPLFHFSTAGRLWNWDAAIRQPHVRSHWGWPELQPQSTVKFQHNLQFKCLRKARGVGWKKMDCDQV